MQLNITLIRHAKTAGNLRGAYIGKTDEPLAPAGIAALQANIEKGLYPVCDMLFASDLTRCLQTAKLIYPEKDIQLCPDLRECDFGDFELQTYERLQHETAYQKWLQSNGRLPFPNGEHPLVFRKRVQKAFYKLCAGCVSGQSIAVVCHGGSIMAILEKYSFPNKDFYHWQVPNTLGFSFRFDTRQKTATAILPLQGGECK